MNWAKTGQILKIGEEIWIKGLNLEENPWKMSILEDLGEFQLFWAVLEERESFEHLGDFQKLTDWTSREYLGLIAILKEELEEVGLMTLVADLKYLNFI